MKKLTKEEYNALVEAVKWAEFRLDGLDLVRTWGSYEYAITRKEEIKSLNAQALAKALALTRKS